MTRDRGCLLGLALCCLSAGLVIWLLITLAGWL